MSQAKRKRSVPKRSVYVVEWRSLRGWIPKCIFLAKPETFSFKKDGQEYAEELTTRNKDTRHRVTRYDAAR